MQEQIITDGSAQEAEEKINAAQKLSYAERTMNIRAEREIVEKIRTEFIEPSKDRDPHYPHNSPSDLATELLKLWYEEKKNGRDIVLQGVVIVKEVKATVSLVKRIVNLFKRK